MYPHSTVGTGSHWCAKQTGSCFTEWKERAQFEAVMSAVNKKIQDWVDVVSTAGGAVEEGRLF